MVSCVIATCASLDTHYNTTISSIALDLSNAAYCEKDQIESWDCLPCQRALRQGVGTVAVPRVFDGEVGGFGKVQRWGTRGFVGALSENRIVVSFRGSANLTNWIEDFDFVTLVPYAECPECKVHEGFYKSWVSVARGITAAVKELRAHMPKADILVTGHSLGAAMAALAAVHLYYSEGLPVSHVYTFGQPRVGNAEFHHFFNNGTTQREKNEPGVAYRVVHWRDPVPRGPFQWMGYEHTSTEVWYNEDSTNFVTCDKTGEDPLCSLSKPFDLLSAGDHRSYLGRPTGKAACHSQHG